MVKKKMTKKLARPVKHTDSLMTKLWLSLVRDFRTNLDDPSFCMRNEKALKQGIRAFREEPFMSKWNTEPCRFKCIYQLESLYKRYINEDDVDPKEVEREALQNFAEFQRELATHKPVGPLAFQVFRRARSLIRSILGPFNGEELDQYVKFGKRANEGVPYAQSYLDCKIASLSGSREHQVWFEKVCDGDTMLSRIIAQCPVDSFTDIHTGAPLVGPRYSQPLCLKASAVPKSFKSNRIIVPNTVLGSMYTYALGRVLEDRLASVGLNIRTLQKKHGRLARSASIHQHLVTADLSKASDLFTSEMINRLLPRDWYNAVKLGRIPSVDIDGKITYLSSFMAMGIGYTFTLQTLIFYAVLKSIAELANVRGRISVYGDDLIYPTRLHNFVVVLFPLLGLKLNKDKTFSDLPFRESCGSDFYKGVDVRPFQPKLVGQVVTGTVYRTFCYKLLNGLLRRWDKLEIPTTVLMLLREILSVDTSIKLVPPDFPDGSGLHFKMQDWAPIKRQLEIWGFTWYIPVSWPVWNTDYQCHSFSYWREVAADRFILYTFPYLWEKLRQSSLDVSTGPFEEPSDSSLLRWIKPRDKRLQKSYRGKFSRKRHTVTLPVVAKKGVTYVVLQEGYI